jgi:hypothetical protein
MLMLDIVVPKYVAQPIRHIRPCIEAVAPIFAGVLGDKQDEKCVN